MIDDKWLALLWAKAGDLALAFCLASFFGLIRYLQEFLGSEPPGFKWFVAIAKVGTAGGVGMLCHWLLTEWKIGDNMTFFLIGIAGYAGAEVLNAAKEGFLDYVRRKASAPEGRDAKG